MDKSILRKTYLEKRLFLSKEVFQNRNTLLFTKIFATINFSTINTIHIFLPIKKFNEVNTWPVIQHIQREFQNVKIAIPKVEGEELSHFKFESMDQLAISKWGIEEPSFGERVSPKEIDLVFVPLTIADKKGHRIGYGKGYYDRFLAECKPEASKIGLSLLPVLDDISFLANKFDIPLDRIICPQKIYTIA